MRGEPRGVVHGQEAVIPLPNGGRVPVQVQSPAGGAQDVKVDVSARVFVDDNGNWQAKVQDISSKAVRGFASSPEFSSRVVKSVRDGQITRNLR
jgi:hypothetical protein